MFAQLAPHQYFTYLELFPPAFKRQKVSPAFNLDHP
jgi:hypothetical protein